MSRRQAHTILFFFYLFKDRTMIYHIVYYLHVSRATHPILTHNTLFPPSHRRQTYVTLTFPRCHTSTQSQHTPPPPPTVHIAPHANPLKRTVNEIENAKSPGIEFGIREKNIVLNSPPWRRTRSGCIQHEPEHVCGLCATAYEVSALVCMLVCVRLLLYVIGLFL